MDAIPRFSILIPTTGRADLIRMALKSIRALDFNDFELIVADSGKSEEIRREIESFNNARMRYVIPPDHGPLSPWDHAAREAKGEYVLWLDDDNYLLPFALSLFDKAITQSRADIVTATHFYFYDHRHPRRHMRGAVGIVPFTGKGYDVNLRHALQSFYSFGRKGPGTELPRFHFSATVISRKVIEDAFTRLGHVLFPDMPNIHSLQPILFAHAKSCYAVDYPVVLVGRLGVSMSQGWSTAARKRFARTPFIPRLSPVSAYTRINGILENFLRVKEALHDLLEDIPVDYARFAEMHMRELLYLDTEPSRMRKNWNEFFLFLRTLNAGTQRRLRPQAMRYASAAPLLYIARRTRLHHLWRAARAAAEGMQRRDIPAAEKFKGKSEFVIKLDQESGVRSVAHLGGVIRDIIQKELGRDIMDWETAEI